MNQKQKQKSNPGINISEVFKAMKKNKLTRQRQYLLDMMQGKFKYNQQDYNSDLLKPDLIISMKLPIKKMLSVSQVFHVQDVIISPSQLMARAFEQAKTKIIKKMQQHKQLNDPKNLKLRYQNAIQQMNIELNQDGQIQQQTQKKLKYISDLEQQEFLSLPCTNEFNGLQDVFTLYFNSIVYTLQKQCGFKVKSFLLQNSNSQPSIFLFCFSNNENLIKLANLFKIKKQVPYDFFDFYLNDPRTSDDRPIRFNSQFEKWTETRGQQKSIQRYFKGKGIKRQQIVQQEEVSNSELQRYLGYMNQSHQILEQLKQNIYELSQMERSYIYAYNRGRINKGCENIFQLYKNRKQFSIVQDELLKEYSYKVLQQPKLFAQFSTPWDKKRFSFFDKLNAVLMYKPMVVGKNGQLSLFSTMERSKLSFLALKSKIRLNSLAHHFQSQVFIPHNYFQKFGNEESQVQGGLDGRNMISRWYHFGVFTDIDTIRTYTGQKVAYAVMFQKYILSYLYLQLVPFMILYAFELTFGQSIYFIRGQVQIVLIGITFKLFMYFWQNAQSAFFTDYMEQKPSKVFLTSFSGPYKRNPITDDVNEFEQDTGFIVWIRNLISLIVIFALVVIFGAIFHGCKMLLVEIHDQYEDLSFKKLYISFPHIIAYYLFFCIEGLSKTFLVKPIIIKKLVLFNNPPSDQAFRDLTDNFTFMYIVLVQLIPSFFFLIIYPYSDTYCYQTFCIDQLFYYVYTRYNFLILTLLIDLLKTIYFYFKNSIDMIIQSRIENKTFKDQLKYMLNQAVKQQNLQESKQDSLQEITSLFLMKLYINITSDAAIIALIANFIIFIKYRLKILYQTKRPLNCSIAIKKLSFKLSIVYIIGLIVNCWANVKTYEYGRRYLMFLINAIDTRQTISQIKLQLIQFLMIFLNVVIVYLIGTFAKTIAENFDDKTIQNRKINKIKTYKQNMFSSKQIPIKERPTPLKTLFRTFGPKSQGQQQFFEKLEKLQIPLTFHAKKQHQQELHSIDQRIQNNNSQSRINRGQI